MRFVQLVLTEEHAQLAAEALGRDLNTDPAGPPDDPVWEERKQLGRVQLLLADAATNPEKYPPTGKMAATVKSVVKRAKGPAQPAPLNKRKARQERRMRTHKERRKFRRQIAESYNRAVEVMEKEKQEAEEFHREVEERVARQPKFRVQTADGQVLLGGIPAEFIISEETEENLLPKIIVPTGGAA